MVRRQRFLDGLAVQLVDTLAQVRDAVLHRHVHHDGNVAETRVHVHQANVGVRDAHKRRGEIRGHRRLADTALGAEDGDDRATGRCIAQHAIRLLASALFLLQNTVDGTCDVLRLQGLDQVVASARHHCAPDGARVSQAGDHNGRGLGCGADEHFDGLDGTGDRLFHGDEEDVRRALIRHRDGVNSVIGFANNAQVSRL